MQVKIGDVIYKPTDQPIMIILNEQDKFNINHMDPTATKYCCFPESMNKEDILKWMEDTKGD